MSDITPRVDIAFKKIFGVEENKDLLILLINSIVSEQDQVEDITLLNPYNSQNFIKDKLSILDIKAKGCRGKLFNIEIQISDEADYDKRALYYWGKMYTDQLKASQDYSELNKAIGIHILNFTSIPGAEKYHHVFHITEKDDHFTYFDDLELHTIELNKFSDKRSDTTYHDLFKKVKGGLDLWIAFLTRHDLLKTGMMDRSAIPNNLTRNKGVLTGLEKALHVLDVMNFNDDERDVYEGHERYLRQEASAIKKGFEDGKLEGKIEGKLEGKIEGKLEGKMEVARNMLSKHIDDDIIIACSGISIPDLAELKKTVK
jgi:predicted transposase/invertase (TIGR01784 family)